MNDIDRPENDSRKSQEAPRCSEIDSIAAMTRREVLSGLREHGLKPTEELPQRLRFFLPAKPPLRPLSGASSISGSRDDRLYAFIVARTSRSRTRIRRIRVHQRWLKVASVLACLVICTALYGIYGAFREAQHLRVEHENARLRSENERQRREQLKQLENRVIAIEDASRRLAEMSGMTAQASTDTSPHSESEPQIKTTAADITAVELRTAELQRQLEQYEQLTRDQARAPSTWPVVAAGEGTVIFAGWKNGYGQVVEIDHSNGLVTRYGHLSKIETTVGHEIARGELLGCVGSTGRSTGPHLHYEVRIAEVAANQKRSLPASIN
jgi:murein DD-endopeptidase MepM/ murein hydrolase activator NlpD